MATTENFYTGNASTTSFGYSFPILQNSDLKVELDGVLKTENTSGTNNDYSISGTNVVFNSAPGQNVDIHIYRLTDVDSAKAVFAPGSSIRAGDLNNIVDQSLFANQEQQQKIRTADVRDNAVTTIKIKDLNVTRPKIANDAIDGTKIADDAVNSEHIAADSIDAAHYAPGSVDTTALGADSVTGAKIADDQINSEHYIAGSIDHEHLANDIIDGDNIQDDVINSEHYVAGSIDHEHLANDIIDSDNIQDNAINSEHYVDGSIDHVHLANDIIDGDNIQDNVINSEHYADASIDHVHLSNDCIDQDNIQDNAVRSEHIQANAVTDSEIATGTLDNRYYTETEAEALFLRQDSSETIASGQTWSNSDAFVATTAAINARIIDLVDEVGGFTVIATELVFPNTNPQGATGQAAILSIGSLTQAYTPSGTTVTIANGTIGNSTVTITGVPSVLPQGFGLLVESTSTLNTYTFHRLVPKATEVTTVASNITNISAAGANVVDINNFADLYQIGGSAPTQRADGSSLQDGDLWFDNSSDNLRVYDGTNWAIVTPAQSVLNDIAIVSGAITYQEDLGLISDAVSTGSSNGSLDIVADALEDERTFTVTAATGKFIIDGVDKPALTLHKGWTYTFDVSDSSNGAHPLRFYAGSSQYSTNVTVTGTQGQAGAKVQIVIPESQPSNFQYYCTNHSGMGNTITVAEDPIKAVADIAANVVTVAGISGNVTTVANNNSNVTAVAGNSSNINAAVSNASNINSAVSNASNINAAVSNATNINTVSASIGDVNRYANEYKISNTAPGSPSAGDLWFDGSTNTLKNYNGSAWLGITSNSGIQNVADDTSPELAAALDCNNFNLTEVGTISGNNLQLDFGTL